MQTLQTCIRVGGNNSNNPSIPNETPPNVGSNVDTCASARTTSAEDGQISGIHKRFAYYKHILIAERYLFWIYHG